MEGLRTDSLYLGPLRVSQILSLAALLALAIALAKRSADSPAALRALPAAAALLLGGAIAHGAAWLCAIAALVLLMSAAILYAKTARGEEI